MEISTTEGEMLLAPNDLGPDAEASRFKPRRDFSRVNAGVPHVRDVAGEQHPCRGPVYPIIVPDHARLSLMTQA
jgi:hypothetical protein